MKPFLSIIVPMYNRAAFIGRALDSCLRQEYSDYEIIVVDDGSRDGSADVLRGYLDPRLRLLFHDANRGVCPARNTALAAARGDWFVYLDSDDELMPGALQAIAARARTAAADVVALRFMCVDDDGRTSPAPALTDSVWDYVGYLRWTEAMRGRPTETLPCARARTFPAVHWPCNYALEAQYHFDIARAGKILACSDIVRRYHQDSGNQLTAADPIRSLRQAADVAENLRAILDTHGLFMRKYSPRYYADTLRAAALSSFLAGKRLDGVRYATAYVRLVPWSMKIYGIVVAGLCDKRFTARLQALRLQARPR